MRVLYGLALIIAASSPALAEETGQRPPPCSACEIALRDQVVETNKRLDGVTAELKEANAELDRLTAASSTLAKSAKSAIVIGENHSVSPHWQLNVVENNPDKTATLFCHKLGYQHGTSLIAQGSPGSANFYVLTLVCHDTNAPAIIPG